MIRRKNDRGGFAGDSLFKIRQKSTGLYFKPEYRNSHFEAAGKAYQTLASARSAALHVSVPDTDVEIVEFQMIEVANHTPSK